MKKILLLISFCCCAFWSEAQKNYCAVYTSLGALLAKPGATPGTVVLSMPYIDNLLIGPNPVFVWKKSTDNGISFSIMSGITSDTLIVNTNTPAIYYCSLSGSNSSFSGSSSPTLNLPIPDNTLVGVSSTLNINNGQLSINPTTSIDVRLKITHTYNSDLYAYLVGPDNCGSLALSTGYGGNTAGMDLKIHTTGSFPFIYNYTTNSNNQIIGDYLTPFTVTQVTNAGGAAVPNTPLTGCPINGNWKLFVADEVGSDIGTLNNWSLTITSNEAAASGFIQIEPSNVAPLFNIRPLVNNCSPIGSSLKDFSATGGLQNDINYVNNSGPNPYKGYADITNDTCSVNASDSVKFIFNNYNNSGVENPCTYINNIWVDWNKDGFFGSNEKILDSLEYIANANIGTDIIKIKIANGTPRGNYKMRLATSSIDGWQGYCETDFGPEGLFTPYGFTRQDRYVYDYYGGSTLYTSSAEFQDFTLNINASAKITGYQNVRCYGNNNTDTIYFHYEGPAIAAANIKLYDSIALNGIPSQNLNYNATTGVGKFYNFPPGTYFINFLLPSGNFILTDFVTITQPTAIAGGIVSSSTNVSCNGGSDGAITLSTLSGGISPYSYSWTSPSGFTATTLNISGLSAGQYSCTIKDANGCTKNATRIITQPDPLVISETHAPIKCNNGTSDSVRIIVTGGTRTYSYNWGSGFVLNDSIHRNIPYNFANPLQVKDSKGCIGSVNIALSNPPQINIATTVTNLSCNGNASGKILTTVTGGLAPYSYKWFFNGSLTPMPGRTSDSLLNIVAGTYYVKVTDALGCIINSLNVTVTQPAALLLSTSITQVTCFGGSNGRITANASNGTAPYQFEWSNSNTVTTGTSSINNNLTAGQYFVYLKDSLGCRQQFSVTVSSSLQMIINGTVVNPTCSFNCDGSISLNNTITNATGPVTYLWNNGSTSQIISSLCVGKDSVTITDSRGCTEKKGFELLASAAERVNLGPDKTLCANQSYYGNVTINNPNLNSPYVWTGPNGYTSNTPIVYINQTGVYYVQVKDNNGCVGKDTINVTATNGIIAAEFIAPTQAYKGRKVTLLNVSSPAPNSIEWQIPTTNLITTLSQTPLKCELVFNDTGNYTIKMKARSGDCDSTFAKTINVIDSTEFGTPSDYILDPLVKRFTVGPNPNSGNFSVQLNLLSNSKIKLRLINILTNQTVNTREETVQKDQVYTFNYNVSVPAGVYILVLETPVTTRIIKVVIN